MRLSGLNLSSECSRGELEEMCRVIADECLSGNFLEIGTAAGGSLVHFIKSAQLVSKTSKFYVLDTFDYYPDQKNKVIKNLELNNLSACAVEMWQGTTDEYFSAAQNEDLTFKFILIDADHKASFVQADSRWLNLLDVGGYAFYHDHSPDFAGVQWAVDRIFAFSDAFEIVSQVDSLLTIRRINSNKIPENYFNKTRGKLAQLKIRLQKSFNKRFK